VGTLAHDVQFADGALFVRLKCDGSDWHERKVKAMGE
jgi:hypothetical protein